MTDEITELLRAEIHTDDLVWLVYKYRAGIARTNLHIPVGDVVLMTLTKLECWPELKQQVEVAKKWQQSKQKKAWIWETDQVDLARQFNEIGILEDVSWSDRIESAMCGGSDAMIEYLMKERPLFGHDDYIGDRELLRVAISNNRLMWIKRFGGGSLSDTRNWPYYASPSRETLKFLISRMDISDPNMRTHNMIHAMSIICRAPGDTMLDLILPMMIDSDWQNLRAAAIAHPNRAIEKICDDRRLD